MPAGGPLSPHDLQILVDARLRAKKIRRAVTVARFDGWTIGIFAALTLLGSAISFSWIALALGVGMAAVAAIELRGAQALAALDLRAPKRLAFNQFFLGALLFAYAAWSLWSIWRNPGQFFPEIAQTPELATMLGSIEDISKLIGLALYGTLILVAITVQGGTALFYLSRARYLRAYIEQTPPWVIEMQRV
jgi:hypothetical protein